MKLKLLSCAALLAASSISQGETLADIYQQALLNDPTYRAAEVEFKIGQNSNYKAWAKFLPQLNIDPTGNYTEGTSDDFKQNIGDRRQIINDVETIVPGTKTDTPGSDFSSKSARVGSLNFNLGISQWFIFKNDLMGDKHAQLTFAQAQQQLIISVTEKYFAVLKSHADLQTAQQAEKLSRLRMELAEEQLAEGLNTITDTHTAKTDFYSAQIDTQSRMVELDQAFEALSLLTGKAHYTISGFDNNIPAPDPSPLDAEKWVQTAVQDGYDLQLRKIERERARNTSKSDKFFYLPTVSASINGGSYTSQPESTRIQQIPIQNPDGTTTFVEQEVVSPSRRSYSSKGTNIGVQLRIPLFGDNGVGLIERRERAQREQIANENFLKSYRQTEFTVRSSFMRILNQKRSLKLQQQRLEQAKLAYDKTQIEYQHGSKSLIDLISQQNSLLNAEKANTQARYGYIEEILKLKRDAGKLTPADIYEINSWLQDDVQIIATQRQTTPAALKKPEPEN